MPNVTIYLVGALLFVVAMGACGVKGYRMGESTVRAEYAARDLQQANEAAALTKKAEEEARAKEYRQAVAQSAISENYERKLKDANDKADTAVAAVQSGVVKLRLTDPVTETNRSTAAQTAANPSGTANPSGSVFFGPSDAAFLVTEAKRADSYALRLNDCEAQLVADRQ